MSILAGVKSWTRALAVALLFTLIAVSAAVAMYEAVRISDIQPRSGDAKGGTSVTITGSGFLSGARVAFGYAPATGGFRYATNVSVESPTTIKATTPEHEPGTVDVIVTNPDGSGAVATAVFSFK